MELAARKAAADEVRCMSRWPHPCRRWMRFPSRCVFFSIRLGDAARGPLRHCMRLDVATRTISLEHKSTWYPHRSTSSAQELYPACMCLVWVSIHLRRTLPNDRCAVDIANTGIKYR
ncbi:hypothetical protein P171DRAFT_219311 [Karstenula rhodostoma CBS 690.94]|uniref:Uncharacterized protein n=1 Tax=Karstenula rhodostoma CBS 690.94 TaxID=1392251 RepID=A0A9P4PTS7_9PLEO|nr:hypothetical protein P171DRAFT_219311 [Karstenula rhodostoma CBS 690.94]